MVMSLQIRKADTDDLKDQLDQLLWQVLWAPLNLPVDIRQQFRLPGPSLELVAVQDGQVKGGVVFQWLEGHEAELRHIAIQPGQQMCGIGRRLVRHGLTLVSYEGCRVVHTISRNTSALFFAKLGFVPVPEQVPDHPIFLEFGIRFQKMVFHCLAERPGERTRGAKRQ